MYNYPAFSFLYICVLGFGDHHPGFPPHGSTQHDEVTVQTLEPVDENTIRLVFSVPPVLVGLHGRVELKYTPEIK